MQVCTSSTAAYTLAVDMKLTQDEAILFCENLGGSSLTFKSSKKELVAFATWFSAKMKGCRHIWTPYSDREEEGKLLFCSRSTCHLTLPLKGLWKSLQNRSTVSSLDPSLMAPGQPNGGHSENGLTIR